VSEIVPEPGQLVELRTCQACAVTYKFISCRDRYLSLRHVGGEFIYVIQPQGNVEEININQQQQ
jgi:hypothetical protein